MEFYSVLENRNPNIYRKTDGFCNSFKQDNSGSGSLDPRIYFFTHILGGLLERDSSKAKWYLGEEEGSSSKRRKRPIERAGRYQKEQSMYEIHNETIALCTNFKTLMINIAQHGQQHGSAGEG